MKRIWPFNGRDGDNGHKNGNGSHADGARPDFLCIGAHKGGTTWLYQQLDSHPDFWMPPFKELHYFDQLSNVERASSPRCRDERDLRFLESIKNLSAKPYIDLEHYARLFEAKGSLLSGDISPNYSTLSNEVIRQVAGYFPTLKVIFLARDPVERVWSHLSMEVRYRQIEPFDVTNIDEVNRNLVRRGLLLRSYPSAVVALDADPAKRGSRAMADYNGWAGVEKLPLTDEVRSHLARFFKKELKTCAARLGGPARDWPARYGFSLVLFLWDLLDDLDLFSWLDWIG